MDPLHRIIHRALSYTLTPRVDSSSGNITLQDLFYLYCMVHERPCQVAECLIRFLFSIRTGRTSRAIYGGGYVVHLARAMGILTTGLMDELPFSLLARPIDTQTLLKMKVARLQAGRYILLDGQERPWVPPRSGDAGASTSAAAPAGDTSERPETSEHHETDTSGRHVSPVHITTEIPVQTPQSAPQQHRFRQTYSRDRLRPLEASVRSLERSAERIEQTQQRQLELQRLEYAHAEAFRTYQIAAMELLMSDSIHPRTSFPRPPSLPQRLRDFYDEAGPSSRPPPDQQPPPS